MQNNVFKKEESYSIVPEIFLSCGKNTNLYINLHSCKVLKNLSRNALLITLSQRRHILKSFYFIFFQSRETTNLVTSLLFQHFLMKTNFYIKSLKDCCLGYGCESCFKDTWDLNCQTEFIADIF